MSVQNNLPRYSDPESPYLIDFDKSTTSFEEINKFFPIPAEVSSYAVPVQGTEEPGFSAVYRNKGFTQSLKHAISKDLSTYHEVMNYTFQSHANNPCFATRNYDHDLHKLDDEYSTITYAEVNQLKKNYGAGLLYLLQHNPYKNSDKFESHRKIDRHHLDFDNYNHENMSFILAIYGPNRKEWVLTDLMCSSFSITSTALYDTLGPDSSQYILETCESPVVVSAKNHIHELIKLKSTHPEALGHIISIISMDPLNLQSNAADQTLVNLARKNGITLFDLDQVCHVGKMFPQFELPPTPDTLYTISFTSGTSGSKAKGVMLTHKNTCAAVAFLVSHLPHYDNARVFSFLPLAHIFERETIALCLLNGYLIGFPRYGGTPLTLVDDLKKFKPHQLSIVPRIITKFESVIKSATVESGSAVKSKVFDHVFQTKMDAQSQYDGATGAHAIYDNALLPKLRKALGFDNMKFIICGSAPIPPSTIKFIKAALNVGFVQGYGLTETFAGCAVSVPFEKSPGTCGATASTIEMRVREIPEMGYHVSDIDGPRGELLMRGPQNFLGYYKNDEETAKALDSEGWFHSGDIARIDKDTGRVSIIDRVKSFFKLAQGEYVAPEKVETQYMSNNPILSQAFVHGNSLHHFLVAIIGVDVQLAKKFLVSHGGIDKHTVNRLSGEQVLHHINSKENRAKLVAICGKKVTKLHSFEKIQNLYVEFEPLTTERNLLTPTVKIKRPFAAKFFKDQIEHMYEEGSLLRSSKI